MRKGRNNERMAWAVVLAVIAILPVGWVLSSLDALLDGRTRCGTSVAVWVREDGGSQHCAWEPTDDSCVCVQFRVWRRELSGPLFSARAGLERHLLFWAHDQPNAHRIGAVRVALSEFFAAEGDAWLASEVLEPDESRRWILWRGVFLNGVVGVGAILVVMGLVAVFGPMLWDWRRFDPLRAGRCPGCGYDLRGAARPLCPECGRAFSERQFRILKSAAAE